MARRVAIVDDHEVVSLALSALIATRSDLEYAGSADTVPNLLRSTTTADLVVLDLNLRDGSRPSDNVHTLREWGAGVLALTSGENPFLIREVSRSASLGIVRKSAPAASILDAIARAAAGEPVITTEWAAAVDSDPDLRTAPLTAREREVLALYASGLGAKSVAVELGISENTVDDHIRRIRTVYRRLGRPANSKVDLYRRGLEDGFLPLPTSA
ncbi:response regulator transcription factor [Herbiconiux ginsengi]|uniref:Two component transcriptional regulator, LuxR family n=1 Tax=Herbiconiux ginsengi TaxID=381665 RepID=A0A1H3T0G1_9MICO|nr:response regulator transcription factor [Herbiconiux ginsengi]SDZ43674.1 two component transcriptional regulator, LuxR family [Herbiconiux ginsengi]